VAHAIGQWSPGCNSTHQSTPYTNAHISWHLVVWLSRPQAHFEALDELCFTAEKKFNFTNAGACAGDIEP
jgi:hypothetical protein